ncbi:MFS transporter [Acidiplasma cupricumulans]|uniref:MFS transporter n=1 Tax=Acidiplasma cupricumulans TaxID=312540 RepID=UPI00158558F1|nr:MFS transporter [Acidiplasma cupricumulans]
MIILIRHTWNGPVRNIKCSFNRLPVLFITRLGLGIFIGVDYAAAVPLLSEYAPAKRRGKLLSTEKLFLCLVRLQLF